MSHSSSHNLALGSFTCTCGGEIGPLCESTDSCFIDSCQLQPILLIWYQALDEQIVASMVIYGNVLQ